MNNETVKIMICAFIMLMLASCASIETKHEAQKKEFPTESGVDISENFLKAMEGIKKVSILADICVAEHMSALLLNESISADHYVLTGIQTFLNKKGIIPILCPAPYVGSYITDETGADVKTDTGIENKKPPFALPSASYNDKEYNEALMKVIASVAVLPSEKKDRNATFKPDINIIKCLSIIADKTGSDALLVVIGQALVYIRDKNNRIIDKSSGATFHSSSPDSIQIIDLRKDAIDGLAVLIDLKNKAAIWSNAARLNLPETGKDYKSFFRDDFPGTMLKDIPFK
jgi:hypothetical protein